VETAELLAVGDAEPLDILTSLAAAPDALRD
jgi:hypothetical protein